MISNEKVNQHYFLPTRQQNILIIAGRNYKSIQSEVDSRFIALDHFSPQSLNTVYLFIFCNSPWNASTIVKLKDTPFNITMAQNVLYRRRFVVNGSLRNVARKVCFGRECTIELFKMEISRMPCKWIKLYFEENVAVDYCSLFTQKSKF